MKNDDFFTWVEEHLPDDPTKLRLKYAGVNSGLIDYAAAITQIECRRKFGKKLADTLQRAPRFYFPSALAGEQSTSDRLAAWHSTLVLPGQSAVDLTAGLGIDAMHAAMVASGVVAVEIDENKAGVLKYNASQMGIANLRVVCGDCTEVINGFISKGTVFGTAFIDPARRDDAGGRVFALTDCRPDVVALMPKLAKICNRLIIKASPMLDITHTAENLGAVPTEIFAVGTPTECKELVVVVDFGEDNKEYKVSAVTLGTDGRRDTFTFTPAHESECAMPPICASPKIGEYILEPSPALMKTGAFRLVAQQYDLQIFHANTRLFVSSEAVADFPGKCYMIEDVIPYTSGNIKRFARKYPQINVAARNFGISAEALRTKLKVREGGDKKLFGITDSKGERLLIVCRM